MDAQYNFVDRYVDRQQVTLMDREQALIVRIKKAPDMAIDVHLPHGMWDGWEWHAEAIRLSTGDKLVHDWIELVVDRGETLQQAASVALGEVAAFLDVVVDAEVRLITKQQSRWLPFLRPHRVHVLEAKVAGVWRVVIPFEEGLEAGTMI